MDEISNKDDQNTEKIKTKPKHTKIINCKVCGEETTVTHGNQVNCDKHTGKAMKIIRAEMVDKLLLVHGSRCWYCGLNLPRNYICLDHIIPRYKEGTNDISNLAISCWACNSIKGVMDAKDFIGYLDYIRSDNFECLIRKQLDN